MSWALCMGRNGRADEATGKTLRVEKERKQEERGREEK